MREGLKDMEKIADIFYGQSPNPVMHHFCHVTYYEDKKYPRSWDIGLRFSLISTKTSKAAREAIGLCCFKKKHM